MSFEPKDLIMLIIAIISFVALHLVKPAKQAASEANKKAESVKDELNEYKLHVAEKYVTDEKLEKYFDRLEKQISELKDMIKRG